MQALAFEMLLHLFWSEVVLNRYLFTDTDPCKDSHRYWYKCRADTDMGLVEAESAIRSWDMVRCEVRCEIMSKTEICFPRFWPRNNLIPPLGQIPWPFNEGHFKEYSELLFHYCVTQLIRMNMSGTIWNISSSFLPKWTKGKSHRKMESWILQGNTHIMFF